MVQKSFVGAKSLETQVFGGVCYQALSGKRRGIRLVVVGMTSWLNVSQLLAEVASSELDYYRVEDHLRNYNQLAGELARDICGRLRTFLK